MIDGTEEKELFKRVGMDKIGYEGFIPTILNGGQVYYIAIFPSDPKTIYTIRFVSWFGHIQMDYQRILNPKLAKG